MCGRTAVWISKQTLRECDAAFFAARVVLFLCNQRHAPEESLLKTLKEFLDELDDMGDGDSSWPEFKVVVVEIATMMGIGFVTKVSLNFSCNRFDVLIPKALIFLLPTRSRQIT